MKRKRSITKLLLLILFLAFVLIQFVPVDRSVDESDPNKDFLAMHANIPQDVALTMKEACYDCHSNKTKYPWYSYIAPVSWWLQNHIDEGREHLNLSLWGGYPASDREELYEEMAEEVDGGAMPLKSYTWIHSKAKLTTEQRKRFVSFMQSMENE